MTESKSDFELPLAAWATTLASIHNATALLDALISPRDAAARVSALPADDLYRYIHKIGLADSSELLPLATGSQIRTFFDVDAWHRDSLQLERVVPWLGALMQAGPETLCLGLESLDGSMINWILRRYVEITVIEDPEDFDPPDHEHVMTPDGRMCIAFPTGGPEDLAIKIYLDWMMRTEPRAMYERLVALQGTIDSYLEDDAYRWRQGRMADLGYVDYYEALGIYTPPPKTADTAPRSVEPRSAEPGLPTCGWLMPAAGRAPRLRAAIAVLDAQALDRVRQAMAWLVNTALSADRVELWDDEAQLEVLERVRAGLELGLDARSPVADANVDAAYLVEGPLSLLFRRGYARMLDTARPCRDPMRHSAFRGPGGRVDAVDIPELLAWAEALSERHPRRPDGGPLATTDDLNAARLAAERLAEFARLTEASRPEGAGIGAWLFTAFTRWRIGLGIAPGPLPVDRLVEAHTELFADGRLRSDARAAATAWWAQLGGERDDDLAAILTAAEHHLASIDPARAEPRFVSFWITGEPSEG